MVGAAGLRPGGPRLTAATVGMVVAAGLDIVVVVDYSILLKEYYC